MMARSYWHVVKEMVKTDLSIFKTFVVKKWVDMFIWIITMTLVYAYIMPLFGLAESYGGFMVASMCSTAGLFQAFAYMAEMVDDFEEKKTFQYYFTLPIPSWLVFVRLVIYYTITFVILGSLVLPVGRILLWNSFSLEHVHWGKFVLITFVIDLFYATFALWVTSFIYSLLNFDSVWMRVVYPLWFLGCFQFSWKALHVVSPVLSYIDLLNPITYISEATRASILGQEGSLNFWYCVIALLIFTVFCFLHALKRLKRRLDFV